MILETIPQVSELSDQQKLLLVAELWDEVSSRKLDIPLSESLKKELQNRETEYLADPEGTTTTWEQSKQRIRQNSERADG